MRHLFLYLLFILIIPLSYSNLTIYNSNFEESSLYSMKDLNYYIATNSNESINLTYSLPQNTTGSEQISTKLNVSKCSIQEIEEEYCAKDTIANYIQSSNTSFSGSVLFNYKQNNSSTQLYLDLFSPTIDINYSINTTSKEVSLNVEVEDNLNYTINSTIELIHSSFNNSQKNLVYSNSTIKNFFNSTIKLNETGKYTIQVTSQDLAGNSRIDEKTFEIEDIFAPSIKDFKVINTIDNNNYINFVIEDFSYLKMWELKIGSRLYSQNYDSNNISKDEVNILVELEELRDLEITTLDKKNNSQTNMYTIDNKIEISNNEKFSNELIIRAINSDSCVLKSDVNLQNNTFEKSNSDFKISINNLDDGEYESVVRCENDNYVNEKEINFEVDTTPPEIKDFEIEALNNGNIELLYDVSEDTNKIEIYRDEERIDSFTINDYRDTFEDSDVSYKEEYEYYYVAKDDAGNEMKSKYLEISPKKASIYFDMAIDEEDEVATIQIFSEENLNAELISRESSNFTIVSFSGINVENETNSQLIFTTENENSEIVILKENNTQNLRFELKDSFNNSITKNFVVESLDYDDLQSEQIEDNFNTNTQNEGVSVEAQSSQNNSSSQSQEVEEISKNSFFDSVLYSLILWLLLFLILLALIILLIKNLPYMENKYYKHKAYSDLKKKREYKNNYSHSFFTKNYSGFKSSSLDKEIDKRIADKKEKEREQKRKEEELKKRRKENVLKSKSPYEQQKFSDLNSHNNNSFNFDNTSYKTPQRFEYRKESKKIQNNTNNEGYLKKSSISFLSQFTGFFSNKESKKDSINNSDKSNHLNLSNNNNYKNQKKDIFSGSELKTSYKWNKSEPKIDRKESESNLNKNQNLKENHIKTNTVEKNNYDTKNSLATGNNTQKNNQKIEWGDYLEKKSKSRRWFLLQKEVDKEIKNR